MKLYHAVSLYQLMLCICLRLNAKHKVESVCILPDFIVQKFPQYKELEQSQIFDQVILFPYSKPRPSNMEALQEVGDDIYNKRVPYPLEEFDEIFCAATHFYFAAYLVMKQTNFHYIEDGSGVIYQRMEKFKEEGVSIDPNGFSLADSLGLIDGNSPFIDRIYADYPEGVSWEDERIVRCNLVDELQKLQPDDLETIKRIFGIENIAIQKPENTLLFLTGMPANFRWLAMGEEKYLYALTVDYYMKQKYLTIKPHPDNLLYNQTVFFDATVLPRVFPIELLLDFVTNPDAHIMSCRSSSIGGFQAKDKICFTGDWESRGYRRAHRYYAAKQLYGLLQQDNSYDFILLDEDGSPFRNWEIEVSYDTALVSDAKPIFAVVGEKSDILSDLASISLHSESVIVFSEARWEMWELMKEHGGCLLERCLRICNDSNGKERKEFIYVWTAGISPQKAVQKLYYEKHLKYAKETVKMEDLSEQELEIAMLKGILEATEQRLLHALEENEELRQELLDKGV